MSDVFREVDEDYRQEQLLQFWRNNALWIGVALIVAIVAASAYGIWQSRSHHKKEELSLQLSATLEAINGKSNAEALDGLKSFIAKSSGHQKIGAELSAAKLRADTGDTDGAIKLYQAILDDSTASRAETGIAEIGSLGLQIDTADPKELQSKLDKLASDDNPWRFSARELQGLLAIRQGDKAAAAKVFETLAHDADAPRGIQSRAANLSTLYAGQ